jgi:hypothetical protein
MTQLIDTLEDLLEAASSMDSSTLPLMGGEDLLLTAARAEQVGRVFDALQVAVATEVSKRSNPAFGADGLAVSYGARNGLELLERVTAASTSTIRRRLRIGAATLPRTSDTGAALPGLFSTVGAALSAGRIGLDAAEAITRELSVASLRAAVDSLLAAERILVASAAGESTEADELAAAGQNNAGFDGGVMSGMPLPADLLRVRARVWRDALDPDGVEPSAEEAAKRRDFWMSRTAKNGVHPFGGAVTPEIAAITLAVMDATVTPRTAPKFLQAEEEADRDIRQDPRTPGQQRADLFAAMVSTFGSSDEFGTPPTVMITTTVDTDGDARTAGGRQCDDEHCPHRPHPADSSSAARLSNTGHISGIADPIPGSVVAQFICDGGFQSVILGPGGRIIKLGSKSRFFTKAQRRAIAARDGLTCIVPGCPIPATASEAHHVKPDHKGGPTHIDNGVLACWWHHRMLDAGIWTITMHDGIPTVHPPAALTRLTRTPQPPMRT